MHTLLTVQEAFEARQAGKSIVCRHVESEIFEKLNNVSADTWFDPHYVFAIEIETITLGGLEFTRPYTLTELTSGDKIYFCGASGKILKGIFNPENEMLIAGVKNGSVQRDEANAIAQVTAFRSLLNIEVEAPIIIDYDFFTIDGETQKPETKKHRGGRKSKDTQPAAENESGEHEPLDKSDAAIKVFTDKIDAASMNYELEEIQASLNDSKDKLHPEEVEQIKALIAEKQVQIDKLDGDTAIELMTERLQSITTIGALNDLEIDAKNQKLATPVVAETCDQLLIDIAAKREELNQLSLIDGEASEKPVSGIEASKALFSEKPPMPGAYLDRIEAARSVEELNNVLDDLNIMLEEHPDNARYYGFLITEIGRLKEIFNQIDNATNIAVLDSIRDNLAKESLTKDQKALFKSALANKCNALIDSIAEPDHHEKIEYAILNTKTSDELAKLESSLTVSDKDHHFLRLLNKRTELIDYEDRLNKLINQVQQAQSIDEANEPVSQTLDWTTEQRLPLITAISKRLVELGKPLIVQIREATELNTLEAYLVQIQELIAVDGTLAHQCMQAYTVRKSALNPTSPA